MKLDFRGLPHRPKDNTIIYDSNRYSVSFGTYNKQPEVRIETKEGILYIQTIFGEAILWSTASPAAEGLLLKAKTTPETAQLPWTKLRMIWMLVRAQSRRVFTGHTH